MRGEILAARAWADRSKDTFDRPAPLWRRPARAHALGRPCPPEGGPRKGIRRTDSGAFASVPRAPRPVQILHQRPSRRFPRIRRAAFHFLGGHHGHHLKEGGTDASAEDDGRWAPRDRGG